MKTQPLTRRDVAIYEAFQAEVSLRDLARQYGLSYQRVQQIVKKVAQSRGEQPRAYVPIRRGADHQQYIDVPEIILRQVREFTISPEQAAARCGCSVATICQRAGPFVRARNTAMARAFYHQVYDEFMAGTSMKDLAKKHDKSVGCIGQALVKARRLWNLPGKWKRRVATANAAR